MPEEMRIILGAASVKAYVASPKAFQVIGIVRFGQEYGLLATDVAGNFFRVNGSQALALHAQTVLRAIAAARDAGSRNFKKYKAQAAAPCATTVTIRKQRHYTVNAQPQLH